MDYTTGFPGFTIMTGRKTPLSSYDKIEIVDASTLRKALDGLALGPLRFFDSIGSTNDEAARWAAAGAPDLALVTADEQTAGRGRMGRRWITPPGSALAFSLVIRPGQESEPFSGFSTHLTALGAMAVAEALDRLYGLPAEIKWPNDVLVNRRKLAGILVEVQWLGERFQAAILGIGVNVGQGSVPDDPNLNFPATSVAGCLPDPGKANRLEVLRAALESLLRWRPLLGSADFLSAWEARLAFKGEWVRVIQAGETVGPDPEVAPDSLTPPPAPGEHSLTWEGQILGLEADGSLRLLDRSGSLRRIGSGELHLRPGHEN